MKKHVACVMLMVLGLIILGLVQTELDSYSNQMTLKVTKENSEVQLQKESCQTTLGTIKAYYSMSETTLLERSLQVKYIEEDYTAFMEEEDKAFVAGGYFTEADFEKQKPYIIIDESVAIRYFGTINCIGESLDIDKVTYSVIGVVAPRFSLGNIINHQLTTVYVPYDFYKGKVTYIMYAYEPIKEEAIINDLEQRAPHHISFQVLRHNSMINPVINWIQFIYCILLVVIFMRYLGVLKKTIQRLGKQYSIAKEKYYFGKLMVSLKYEVLKAVGVLVVGGILVVIICQLLDFRYDTRYIPSTLAFHEVVEEKMTAYMRDMSTMAIFTLPVRNVVYWGRNVVFIVGSFMMMMIGYMMGSKHSIRKENK